MPEINNSVHNNASDPRKRILHVVAGPTASGKTDYALTLAREVNGELINADSRQIYQFLDIGTNKGNIQPAGNSDVSEFTLENVPLHLVNILNPDQQFDVHTYQQKVFELLPQIWQRGHIPILVGGTGLYIDAVLHPERYSFGSSTQNGELRVKLNELTTSDLQVRVNELNADILDSLNDSDRNNPRRLIRLIEKLSEPKDKMPPGINQLPFEPQVHLVNLPLNELTERINKRVDQMWQEGLVNEVKNVLELGYSENSTGLQGIGYREVLQLLHGELTEEEAVNRIKISHRQYAKRQVTWFKKYL